MERNIYKGIVLYEGGISEAPFYEKYARAETISQNKKIDQIIKNLSIDHPNNHQK